MTSVEYDAFDRPTQLMFADGNKRSAAYNSASDVTSFTDENGSVFDCTYDVLSRLTQVDITKAGPNSFQDRKTFRKNIIR